MNYYGVLTNMTATLKQAQEQGIAPWDDAYFEDKKVWIFRDRYPVSPGHLLFVPKVNTPDNIMDCFRLAQRYGEWVVLKGDADAYNIGMNCGTAAGQTVMYPHVHMIPRRHGDVEDPVGGVRGVIPGQANYKTPSYNPGK
jgi:diadenosine tetraphosphate (Ap4A) HIT family hydrolase